MSSFFQFVEHLRLKLQAELPGEQAQYRMAPDLRMSRENLFNTYKVPREAAVLILLFTYNGLPAFCLIERPVYEGAHSGQIALPGGKVNENELPANAALRETHEELGVAPDKIEIIGQLTDLIIPVSNFRVIPIIGYLTSPVEFIPDSREVCSFKIIPVMDLLDTRFRLKQEFTGGAGTVMANCYAFDTYKVWGATAMILSEFSELIKDILYDADIN